MKMSTLSHIHRHNRALYEQWGSSYYENRALKNTDAWYSTSINIKHIKLNFSVV